MKCLFWKIYAFSPVSRICFCKNDGHPKENKSHFLPVSVCSPLFSLQHLAWGLTEAAAPPAQRYYGNAIWAYQDLKPKDILDNNTIAAQPGYLRDLDLRGEIWGVADWTSKSSLFCYLNLHTSTARISPQLENLRGKGTICGIRWDCCYSSLKVFFFSLMSVLSKKESILSWTDYTDIVWNVRCLQ